MSRSGSAVQSTKQTLQPLEAHETCQASTGSLEPPITPETSEELVAGASPNSSTTLPLTSKYMERQADPYMKTLPDEFDPDPETAPERGLWVIYADGPPEPSNQEERLQTVHKLGLLDRPEDPVLNSICDLTCSVFQSLVAGISVVDKHRLWYHAMGGAAPRFQHHISLAFCGWNMLPVHPEVLVIEDTLLDRRFMECPAILHPPLPGTPAMRFYAGAPLIMSNGHRIGSLCLMDIKPRTLSAEEAQTLSNFAEMAARHIEQDLYFEMQKFNTSAVNQTLLRSAECFTEATMILDMSEPGWKVLYANQSWSDVTDTPHDALLHQCLLDLYQPEDESAESLQERVRDCIQESYGFYARMAYDKGVLRLRFRSASRDFYTDKMSERTGIPSHLKAHDKPQKLFIAVVIPDMGPNPADITPSSSISTPAILKGPSADQEWLQGEKGVLVKSGLPGGFPEAVIGILIKATPQGRIFRGQWHNSPVAIKVTEHFEEECVLVGDTGFYAPAEATLSITVAHPHLVTAYKYALALHEPSAEEKQGNVLAAERAWVETWLVREHCGRGCLTDALLRGWLQREKRVRSEVNLVAVLATAAEVSGALQCLHSAGLVHGNLTADCVWLADANNVRGWSAKVLDFGAQRPHLASSSHPARKRITHAAPELLEKGDLSTYSDVYAMGVLIWEMCAQNRIFAGMSVSAALARIIRHEPVPHISKQLPPDIKDLIQRCMAANPEDRPSTSQVRQELIELLRVYQGQEQTAAQEQSDSFAHDGAEPAGSPSLLRKVPLLKKVASLKDASKDGASPIASCNPLKILRSSRSPKQDAACDEAHSVINEE